MTNKAKFYKLCLNVINSPKKDVFIFADGIKSICVPENGIPPYFGFMSGKKGLKLEYIDKDDINLYVIQENECSIIDELIEQLKKDGMDEFLKGIE